MPTENTVYVVDDDEAVRDSLAALLSAEGFHVVPFESGVSFLTDVSPSSRGCILMDVKMPGLDGLEVQQELSARGISLPVVLMTGHADVPMAVKAMKAGAVDFIEKPYMPQQVISGIRQALARPAQQSQVRSSIGSSEEVAKHMARLSPREHEVLHAVVHGRANKQIGFDLGISTRTVEIHRSRVMEKMRARSLADLVRMALMSGID